MAVTGKAIIAPLYTDVGVKHHMEDIVVDVPAGQDGVWSNPSSGTRVSDIHVAGGNGTNNFGIRIGGTSLGEHGMYRDLSTTGSDRGLYMTEANRCTVMGVDVMAPKREGLLMDACDDSQVVGISIDTPSFGTFDGYSAIRVSGLGYRNRVSEIMMPDDGTDYHIYAVDCTSAYDTQIGAGSLAEGRSGFFKESAYANNDFGLELSTYSLATVIDTTGSGLLLLPFAQDAAIYAILMNLRTAPTGSAVIADVNKNDSTVFPTTTKPTIAVSGTESVAYPDNLYVAGGNFLTVDIDQADSNGVAEGLTVSVSWRRV